MPDQIQTPETEYDTARVAEKNYEKLFWERLYSKFDAAEKAGSPFREPGKRVDLMSHEGQFYVNQVKNELEKELGTTGYDLSGIRIKAAEDRKNYRQAEELGGVEELMRGNLGGIMK